MNIKSQLAPKGLEFDKGGSFFTISDKYATILTVVSYPRFVGAGYLANITNMSGVKMVIKHLPLSGDVIRKMLNKEIADLRARYDNERDNTMLEKYRQDMDSLDYFIQQFTASQSKTFDFQMHLMLIADTKEGLENKKMQVKNYLDAMEMKAIPLRFEQQNILKSIIPIFPNQAVESRIGTPMPSPTMAAMYPFIYDTIKDEGS